jgi:hypothetical protein
MKNHFRPQMKADEPPMAWRPPVDHEKGGASDGREGDAYWNRPGARNVLRNGGASPDDEPDPADVGRTLD